MTAGRRLGVLFIGLLLSLASGILGPAGSAQAAWSASCTYSACDGQSPHTSNCDDDPNVRTITYVHPASNWNDAQLRYSPGCHAYWVRAYGYTNGSSSGACNGGPPYQGGRLRVQSYSSSAGWTTYGTYNKSTSDSSCPPGDVKVWTKMLRSGSTGYRAQVCRNLSATAGTDGDTCTGWHVES